MIIQCQSCSRKFIVKDSDIPKEGRTVQCSYCSVNWHQMPPLPQPKILKLEKIFYRRTLNNSKLKTKLSIIYFYIKRLILFKEQFTKRNLPNEI